MAAATDNAELPNSPEWQDLQLPASPAISTCSSSALDNISDLSALSELSDDDFELIESLSDGEHDRLEDVDCSESESEDETAQLDGIQVLENTQSKDENVSSEKMGPRSRKGSRVLLSYPFAEDDGSFYDHKSGTKSPSLVSLPESDDEETVKESNSGQTTAQGSRIIPSEEVAKSKEVEGVVDPQEQITKAAANGSSEKASQSTRNRKHYDIYMLLLTIALGIGSLVVHQNPQWRGNTTSRTTDSLKNVSNDKLNAVHPSAYIRAQDVHTKALSVRQTGSLAVLAARPNQTAVRSKQTDSKHSQKRCKRVKSLQGGQTQTAPIHLFDRVLEQYNRAPLLINGPMKDSIENASSTLLSALIDVGSTFKSQMDAKSTKALQVYAQYTTYANQRAEELYSHVGPLSRKAKGELAKQRDRMQRQIHLGLEKLRKEEEIMRLDTLPKARRGYRKARKAYKKSVGDIAKANRQHLEGHKNSLKHAHRKTVKEAKKKHREIRRKIDRQQRDIKDLAKTFAKTARGRRH